jgi:hypothetical protein
MKLRSAEPSDYGAIDNIYSASGFVLDPGHLQRVLVVEDEDGIVAVGSLSTIIEGTFLTDDTRAKREKAIALMYLMDHIDTELQSINYDHINVFCTNESIGKILKRKFEFVKTKAIEVLVRGVRNGKE